MNKNILVTMIVGLTVLSSTQNFAAAPARAPLSESDLIVLLDRAQSTEQVASVLIKITKADNMSLVEASQRMLFEQMSTDNRMGQLSVARADVVIEQTYEALAELGHNGERAAQSLNLGYYGKGEKYGRLEGVRAKLK